MLDSPCLKDTKSGASATAGGSEFQVMTVQYKRRDSSIILASRVDLEHFPRKKNKKLARIFREFRMNFAKNFVASRGAFPRYARAWRGNFTCGGKSSRVDGTKITWNLKYVLTT